MKLSLHQKDDSGPDDKAGGENVGMGERSISAAVGIKLGLSGFLNLFRKPFSSILKIGAGGYLLSRGLTGHCDIYQKAGKVNNKPIDISIRTSVEVNRPKYDVYEFWRKLDNLPLFMNHLNSVELFNDGSSKWTLKIPVNFPTLSWRAAIIHDEPGEIIEWRSVEGSVINNRGRIRFIGTPDPDVTLIHISISYHPPAGIIGTGIARIFNPVFKKMVEDDIKSFKQFMEIGNVTDDIAFKQVS